jgi:hypothetical protein
VSNQKNNQQIIINKVILGVVLLLSEGLNQSKTRASCSPEIDLVDLCSLRFYSKYLMMIRRQRRARKGGSAEICPSELMTPWIYDKKFSVVKQFMFETLSFTVEEDNNLEHPAQGQEERHTMTIGFEFHRGLKNSATTFQAAVRQPATTNLIDSLARLPIRTTRSSGLALGEIRTTKPKESA